MRVLFTFAGGSGHADPLVPIADAVRSVGHEVAFVGRRSSVRSVEANGFPVLEEPAHEDADARVIASLRPLDMEHEYSVLREYYAGRSARARAGRVLEACAEWRPELIVCDEVDFGSMIAAERLELPHATVLVTACGSFVRPEVVVDALNEIRAEHGLPPDPTFAMPSRHLMISPIPPSFRDPSFPLPANTISIRPDAVAEAPQPTSPPTVYFTLGTVFNIESGDLFGRVLAGLRELPIQLIVTVGRELDPERFGPQPGNVRIERFIPQEEVLSMCDAVVNHGGSGSVVGALAYGLPMVVLPMGADQALNAGRCEALGLGIALDAAATTPTAVGQAVAAVLREPRYRAAAVRVRDEIAGLPEAKVVVPALEGLARA